MPIYIYECEKCKRTFEVRHSINWIAILHSDITEGHIGLPDTCDGKIKRIIQPPGLSFKGKGWTQKFFR